MLPQGGTAYGAQLGYMKTPARESDARLLGPNFYYDREDPLRSVAAERGYDRDHAATRGRDRVRHRQPDEPAHGHRRVRVGVPEAAGEIFNVTNGDPPWDQPVGWGFGDVIVHLFDQLAARTIIPPAR